MTTCYQYAIWKDAFVLVELVEDLVEELVI